MPDFPKPDQARNSSSSTQTTVPSSSPNLSAEGIEILKRAANYGDRKHLSSFDLMVFRRLNAIMRDGMHLNVGLAECLSLLNKNIKGEIASAVEASTLHQKPLADDIKEANAELEKRRTSLKEYDPHRRAYIKEVDADIQRSLFVYYYVSKIGASLSEAELKDMHDPKVTIGKFQDFLSARRTIKEVSRREGGETSVAAG